MKSLLRIISCLAALVLLAGCLAACGGEGDTGTPDETDYAASVTLDMSSGTLKQAVTVRSYIDGDTTHFNVPESVIPTGLLKARYLAVNTPESTGKIEEYGKAASKYTKEKLSDASEIIVESDDGNWNLDSTGTRYLVWVWYKPSSGGEYRNLNIEILQKGLAIASSSANNRYGSTCTAAIAQAKELKYSIYSGQRDPDFFYGEAVELTLKELRCNIDAYNGTKVAFEGVITVNDDNSVYVESYDAETEMYYGITVYYGFSLSGEGLEILAVGNLSRIVGTVQFYETGGTYQVSGLTYRQMKPDDPGNIRKLDDGKEPGYPFTTASQLMNGKVTVEVAQTPTEFDYAELAMSTSLCVEGLTVKRFTTTTDTASASYGAFTLYCEAEDGTEVAVRTVPFRDASGKLITGDAYVGRTITVKGFIDYFYSAYQIKVFSVDSINYYEIIN